MTYIIYHIFYYVMFHDSFDIFISVAYYAFYAYEFYKNTSM